MKSEILIIGAGPTGLTLACTLAQRGIKAKIIDKRACSSQIPRAINITSPVLNILNQLDLGLDELKGKELSGLKVYWDKKPLLNINYRYFKPKYPFIYHLEQSTLEVYLEARLNSMGVNVERQIAIDNLINNDNGVTVTLSDKEGNLTEEMYRYVIGCDGGNSSVRNLVDIYSSYELYPCHFVLADCEVNSSYTNDLNKIHYYLNDEGYLIVAPISDKKCRLIVSFTGNLINEGSNFQEDNNFKSVVSARGPEHFEINNIVWATSGNFFHRIANTASKGNVFLAGDALHQFSPVGGANMNAGIQDAYSLGLKMSASLRNEDSINSLADYSDERLVIAKKYIDVTKEMTRLLTRYSSLDNNDVSRFMPEMKNRVFIKHTLPEIFSGEHFTG